MSAEEVMPVHATHEGVDPLERLLDTVTTGYGVQTELLCKRLLEAGHEPAVSAYYGVDGRLLVWNDVPHYPVPLINNDPWGNHVLIQHAEHHFGGDKTGGLVIPLLDAYVMQPDVLAQMHVAFWAPVDHDPAPPAVVKVLSESGCQPVAMSRHGEQAMRAAGLDPFYVPHAVDTTMFAPRDRAECRDRVGLPRDAFIVGMVGANKGYPSRKSFPEVIAAFARFSRTHDDAILHLHTEPQGYHSGFNIGAALALERVPPERVRMSDPYIGQTLGSDPEYMVDLYNAFDVLLNPARGEGFGVPILEAAACGTPAIVTDWTAMPEVGRVGWRVSGQRLATDQRAFQVVPAVDAIVFALERAHVEAHTLRGEARAHAETYDTHRVFVEHWTPLLDLMAKRMEPVKQPRKRKAKAAA